MYLGVDVGGTKTLLAAFSEGGELSKEVRFETSKEYQEFLKDFESHLSQLESPDFRAAGVAIPGRINRQEGIGLRFGNLDWQNVPIQTDLENILKCPVVLENDAKAGALYEALNVKNEFKHVLYVAIGTGIGIGLVTNGVIDSSIGDRGGNAIVLDYKGERKSWEKIVSGKAIVQRYGKRAEEINDEASWKSIARDLSLGILDVIAITEPEVVIVGGGVGLYFDKFADYLWQELKQYETPMMQIPPIRQANKPEEAVIYGCYELVKQKYGQSTN